MTTKKKKNYYVDNKKLLEEIKAYQAKKKDAEARGAPLPRVPEYIGKAIQEICTRIAMRHNFRGYSYADEFVAEGMMDCVVGTNYFDTEKYSSPFSYFTQIAWYAALRVIAREQKQSYVKIKSMQEQELKSVLAGEGLTADSIEWATSDTAHALVQRFEEKRARGSKKNSVLRKKKR